MTIDTQINFLYCRQKQHLAWMVTFHTKSTITVTLHNNIFEKEKLLVTQPIRL